VGGTSIADPSSHPQYVPQFLLRCDAFHQSRVQTCRRVEEKAPERVNFNQ
jgi:hypothetical protein